MVKKGNGAVEQFEVEEKHGERIDKKKTLEQWMK